MLDLHSSRLKMSIWRGKLFFYKHQSILDGFYEPVFQVPAPSDWIIFKRQHKPKSSESLETVYCSWTMNAWCFITRWIFATSLLTWLRTIFSLPYRIYLLAKVFRSYETILISNLARIHFHLSDWNWMWNYALRMFTNVFTRFGSFVGNICWYFYRRSSEWSGRKATITYIIWENRTIVTIKVRVPFRNLFPFHSLSIAFLVGFTWMIFCIQIYF